MKHAYISLRPGMTAIVAAITFASTPLFAQNQDISAAESAAPVIAAPPPAADVESATPLNIPKITINMDDAPQTTDAVSAGETRRTAPVELPLPMPARNQAVAAQPTQSNATTAQAESTAPARRAAPKLSAAESLPTPPISSTELAPTATLPVSAETPSNVNGSDDVLPIAGGMLGVFVLAGGAFAFLRRRHRNRFDHAVDDSEAHMGPEPLVLEKQATEQQSRVPAVPTATTPLMARKVVEETAGTEIAGGFDLSRYGRHVQAAYRGPTPENPSLSLRKRLKRARFHDQRERVTAATTPTTTPIHTTETAVQTSRRTTEFVSSRRFKGGNAGFRPAYQS